MKAVYENPKMYVQNFVPNEYVAACGNSGTVYWFQCNAGSEWYGYNVFMNGEDGKPGTSDDIAWTTSGWYDPIHLNGSYSPCGTRHRAESDSGFYDGYMYRQGYDGKNTGRRIDVIIWTNNGTNTHCTTNLKQNEWETAKS